MIDIKKQYRTRDGREARIYATDGSEDMCVHGAIRLNDGWACEVWTRHGLWIPCKESVHDLIEVKPRIQREVWVNVYEGDCVVHSTKVKADNQARSFNRLACVKIDIDCEEGTGL